MTDIEKCYYLQGYIELGGWEVPDEKTWEKIKKLVEQKESITKPKVMTFEGQLPITDLSGGVTLLC
jgi:hypothetical protein